jgi:hypothetical protein
MELWGAIWQAERMISHSINNVRFSNNEVGVVFIVIVAVPSICIKEKLKVPLSTISQAEIPTEEQRFPREDIESPPVGLGC